MNDTTSPPADRTRAFWADAVADEIEARDPAEPIVIKGAVSPSGIPHLGHLNEILRGYYVAEVLRERGHEVRQVFTSDDRDALRKLPRRLADADWELVELGDVDAGALGRNLGVPYTDIPDPFGDCHDSYGDHFTDLLRHAADLVGVPLDVVSTTDCYEDGTFDGVIRETLERADLAREVLSAYQDSVDETYVPFMPNCASCGRQLTTEVTEVDLEGGAVRYACVGAETADREIDGCGHRGTATFREGKLPWRFEWPAGWKALGVDFEPFGKDHAEGSWPSGEHIAREVYGIDPPVPMVYEWFTLNGAALSSSGGNVVTVPELLELVEPEVIRYFFALEPNKQRDLDLSRIDQLVDEFDRFERVYFGEEPEATPTEQRRAERIYPFLVEEVAPSRIRLPYTFAAVLGMTEDPSLRTDIARREGHIPPDASPATIERALERVNRARTWARRTDNEYNYELKRSTRPAVAVDDATARALDDVANVVADGADGEAIQSAIYEAARRHDIGVGELFSTGYRLFLDRTEGPKLGPFLAQLDREFVVDRLRRVD